MLAEMRGLGLQATEAGADGFLPEDGGELARTLAAYDLDLVGGFAPVVLHDPAAPAGHAGRRRGEEVTRSKP